MTRPDPFTNASPTYQAAIRHPHKSGEAFENMNPPRSGGLLVFLGVMIVCAGLLALRLAGAE